MGVPACRARMAASAAPRGAPVPGWPTSIRRMPGAPGGSAAAWALAALITSITRKGGAAAPRPVLSAIPLLVHRAERDAGAARVAHRQAAVRPPRQVVGAGRDLGPRGAGGAALQRRIRRQGAPQLARRPAGPAGRARGRCGAAGPATPIGAASWPDAAAANRKPRRFGL